MPSPPFHFVTKLFSVDIIMVNLPITGLQDSNNCGIKGWVLWSSPLRYYRMLEAEGIETSWRLWKVKVEEVHDKGEGAGSVFI